MGDRRTGWLVAMLAGMLFMEGRREVPHFVDDSGNRFKLHFAPLRVETSRPMLPRSSLLHEGRSAPDDRPLVPIPAWSLPEVFFGKAEEDDGTFSLEDEVRSQAVPSELAACGAQSTTTGTDCRH
jgi:hypothetical protein